MTSLYNANPAGRYGRDAVRTVFPRHREKYARLAAIAPVPAADVTAGPAGTLTLEFDAPGHSVRLIELRRAGTPATR